MSKSRVKELRKSGKIPGSLQGKGKASIPIEVALTDLAEVFRTEAGIYGVFDIDIEGAKREDGGTAVVKEIQTNPINRKILHVDFQRVSLSDIIVTSLPIELHGTAIGSKEGGTMEQMMNEVEVKSRADQIPPKLDVDVTNLQIGQFIYAADIPLPDGVELASRPDDIVVAMRPPHIHGEPQIEQPVEEPGAETITPPAAEAE